MSYKPGWRGGRWSTICDRCGFRFHSDKIKTEWTGLKVCGSCWETRNPQDFLRLRPEKIVPEYTRPEQTDTFLNAGCYLWESSAYPGLAGAGCAIPNNTTYTPEFLLELKG
jgi:hypothetical protein